MQSLSKFMLEKVMGWKVVNRFPTELKKYIIIVAPHTSWVDFPVGVFVNYSEKLGANYIAKHTLFKPPFGFMFKALGGTPVDRSKSESRVEAIIKIFNESERFVLTLSPEGTRKAVSKWKTGFYYVAKGAKIPIVMCAFNYEKKEVVVAEPYTLTGDEKTDFQHFHDFFKNMKGKKRDQFNPDFHLNL